MGNITQVLCDRKYFKWWYFDIHCNSGLDIVLIFHVQPFFSNFDIGLVDIVVYKKNSKIIHRTIVSPIKKCTIVDRPLSLYIGTATMTTKSDAIFCHVDDSNIKLHLEFKSEAVTRKTLMEPICVFDGMQTEFWWQVKYPRINAAGFLCCDGENITIEGIGYHDCNWGTVSLPRHLDYWNWGRYLLNDEVFIYATVRDRQKCLWAFSMHVNGNGEQHMEHYRYNQLDDAQKFLTETMKCEIVHTSHHVIDEDMIFISPLSRKFRFINKIAEFMFFRLKESRIFKPMCVSLSNVNYKRIKKHFYYKGQYSENSVHEEMRMR
ncbi:MAG: hypothetical protein R2940_06285 [Syntrophotaleaceae bacterium]